MKFLIPITKISSIITIKFAVLGYLNLKNPTNNQKSAFFQLMKAVINAKTKNRKVQSLKPKAKSKNLPSGYGMQMKSSNFP
jgi:hypothetical protein